jgi:hypothetical protein
MKKQCFFLPLDPSNAGILASGAQWLAKEPQPPNAEDAE